MQLITINGQSWTFKSLKLSDRRYFTDQRAKNSPTPSQQFPKHCLARHFLFPSCFVLFSIDFFRHTKFLYFKVIHERRAVYMEMKMFPFCCACLIIDSRRHRVSNVSAMNNKSSQTSLAGLVIDSDNRSCNWFISSASKFNMLQCQESHKLMRSGEL